MAKIEIAGYELYEILGRGGMAVVYRALHLNLDREVAIKVMDTKLNADQTFSERFIREARISARLVHPHILQIYDVNSHDTLNYISMELLEGGDLSHFIRSSMKQRTIYDVMEQITGALDYAAGMGYVHRDIKPSNIMLRGDNEYVLADFGIAKAANSGTQMTQTGLMVGTPSYMSPEQAKGVEVDGRSDLYSMAIVCYEMLTKELPYDSDSAVSTAVKHLTEQIPELPERLAAYQPFINKGMAKNADERFQTGREMFAAFCEVRGEFSDDEVLTEGKAPPKRRRTGSSAGVGSSAAGSSAPAKGLSGAGSPPAEPSGAGSVWDDSTQLATPSRSSRPYKLTDTGHREPLVSGIRGEQRAVEPRSGGAGSTAFRIVAALVLVGGLGFGGYTWWQQNQGAATGDLRAVASELAAAYSALNNDDYEKAAIAFRKVLSIDARHAAARQGMAEVEVSYIASIESALSTAEVDKARRQYQDFALLFTDSSSLERLKGAIDLAAKEKELESVQSDRIGLLIGKANTAMTAERLFEPASDNAYLYIRQALALDDNSNVAGDALSRLLNAALEQVYHYISDDEFGTARDLISRLRQIDPGLPSLSEAQRTVERAEETELKRQERWASFSEEKRRSILEQLARAEDLLAKGIYTSAEERSAGENAQAAFAQVLELDPDNASALGAPQRIARIYLAQAEQAKAENRFEDAGQALASAASVAPDYPGLAQQRGKLVTAQDAYQRQSEFQARVDAILARADAEFARVSEGVGHAEDAARYYREALELDLENQRAQDGLSRVTQYYLTSANEAMAYGEFKRAGAALDSAETLAPGRDDIAELRRELRDREAQWVTGQSISVLVETGQKLVDEGSYVQAAEKFEAALKLSPDNQTASAALVAAVDELVERARRGAETGNFIAVRGDLESAQAFAPGREDVSELLAELPAMERAWKEGAQVNGQIEDARALFAKGHYTKSATVLQEVLQANPDSRAAQQEFDKAIAALVRHAEGSIERGDFPRARSSLASANRLAPGEPAAQELLAELPELQAQWERQQDAIAKQAMKVQEWANTATAALANGDLDLAGQTYDRMAQEYPEADATLRLKRELLAAYIAATREQISNKEYDAAEDYLTRGQSLAPNYAAWRELEDEIDVSRTSNRRRLGAY